jgi:hypothetical protein
MAEFLAETYVPRETANAVVGHVADVARAADQVREREVEVRLLGAVFLPADETCFYLYESPSADAVRAAALHARLPFDRITEAVSMRPPQTGALPPADTTSYH